MSNEKHPEPSHWRDRLEEAEMPVEWGVADKAAAWDKLHVRLGGVPRRRRAVWYWMAAACLLILVSLGGLLQERPAVKAPARRAVQVRGLESTSVIKTVGLYNSDDHAYARSYAGNRGQTKRAISQARIVPAETVVAVSGQTTDINIQADSGIVVVPRPELRVKKQMRILSINELDNPTGANPSVVSNPFPGSFWLSRTIKINLIPQN